MEHTPPPQARLAATDGQRLFFLDWLRILAFALLVPYHVGMYYVSWGWHVKSPAASTALEPFMLLSAPWRLGLLFFIGGVALAQAWGRSPAGLLRRRSARLLLPWLFGILLIVPPQSYIEVIHKLGYSGSYLEFMRLALRGYGGFCRIEEGRRQCLSLPAWNHLWFLPYLWLYGLIAWVLMRRLPAWLDTTSQRLAALGPVAVLLGLSLPLVLARQLAGAFPSTHNLTWDWYNHAQYLSLFVLGLLAAKAGASFWARLGDLRVVALLGALASWGLLLSYFAAYADATPPESLRVLMRGIWGLMQWWAMVAACGFAYRHLNFDSVWRQRLSAAVFCVYILHQTLIVLLTQALLPWQLAPIPEGLLLIGLTFALCTLGYGLARLLPAPLALLLGVDKKRNKAQKPQLVPLPQTASTMAAVSTAPPHTP
ncbi:acyltransferase family protein [Paucibacter sp. Y2R2-4]|uniref:acyltransferase family protein n=1 Tax=Paucibacter sp. Y2R2-4 TaxID=2893553 RepID=UPI0021E3AA3E|nr:acyltransferase family protein [Paucibacter sp. Y2R2-4]MCV2351236.1 acyltransferase family protein [Paucibacter sp. Y2R2-4]